MNPEHPLPDAPPPQPRPADPLIGQALAGRYRVHRLIARGGMGAVYEAEQLPLGRRVALKVLTEPASSGDREAFAHRFFLEASSLARLSHPHTVTLFDYGQTDDGTYYLVMEYVDGKPLSKLLQNDGPLPPDRAIRIMLQVARAVANAHRHGVVHRDLKPSNLLVASDPDGGDHVKVVDFGLAKLTEGDQSITVTGMILGSPHCMAPEQVNGADVDERTDIYALGVLLFRCVTGHYPFHGSTTTATMIAHIQNPIPTLAEVCPGREFPAGLEDVIRRALAKDPAARYPQASALIRDLAACGQVPSDELSAVSTITLPPTRQHRAVLPAAALGGLLLGLAAVVGYALVAEDTPPPEAPVVQPAERDLRLVVRSTPEGAAVEVGGEVLGRTPLSVDRRVAGGLNQLQVTLKLAGHQDYEALRDIAGRDTLELDVALAPEPAGAAEAPAPAAPKAAPTPTPKAAPAPKAAPQRPASAAPAADEGPDVSAPDGYKANPFD